MWNELQRKHIHVQVMSLQNKKIQLVTINDAVCPILLYTYKLYTGLKYSMTYQHAICR